MYKCHGGDHSKWSNLTFFRVLFLACLAFGLRCVYLFFSVWFRVDSGLGRWFIAGWRAKFYLKSVQGLIRNLSKIHVSFGFGFGFVLGWVNLLFGIRFKVYLRLVENLKLAWGLTLRCACSFPHEGFRIFLTKSLYIYIYVYIHIGSSL